MNDFAAPIEEARNRDASDYQLQRGEKANLELQEKIKPYFLQRFKADVLADKLPSKTDNVIWTHISNKQRSMYENYVGSKESAVASVLRGETKSPLEAITWLKKLCGHPILVDQAFQGTVLNMKSFDPSDLVQDSSKLEVLVGLVRRHVQGNHRTLIFSQSTRMLDVIERVLSSKFKLARIDGSTKEKDRPHRVDDFNEEGSDIQAMLLSTKAAGVGLTLTGADRAIIYDPSWNPAEDSQAIDRCYRIGQTKPVVVYRLIAAGTVEEKMYEKQIHKDGLRRAVTTSTGNSTERFFEREELRKMFSLGEAGQCDVLKRLEQEGKSLTHSGEALAGSSYSGVVGISSHDSVYNSSSKTAAQGPGLNPFSQKPNVDEAPSSVNAGSLPQKVAEPKKLGRSKTVLRKQSGEENEENIMPSNNGNITNNIQRNQNANTARNPKAVLIRANGLNASGDQEMAMTLLMDLLEEKKYGHLDKDVKAEVHDRIATLAEELCWL